MLYARLPEPLLRDKSLSDRAVRLYGLLDRYAGAKAICWPSRDTLADDLDCSPASVDRAVAQLKGAGWIHVRRRGQRDSNVYTVRRPQAVDRGVENPPGGV